MAVTASRDPGASPRFDRTVPRAHLEEGARRIETYRRAAARWWALKTDVVRRAWPDRLVIALEQALMGGNDRARYTVEADISQPAASNDFRRLVDAGLIVATGRGRMVWYGATERLRAIAPEGRIQRVGRGLVV